MALVRRGAPFTLVVCDDAIRPGAGFGRERAAGLRSSVVRAGDWASRLEISIDMRIGVGAPGERAGFVGAGRIGFARATPAVAIESASATANERLSFDDIVGLLVCLFASCGKLKNRDVTDCARSDRSLCCVDERRKSGVRGVLSVPTPC